MRRQRVRDRRQQQACTAVTDENIEVARALGDDVGHHRCLLSRQCRPSDIRNDDAMSSRGQRVGCPPPRRRPDGRTVNEDELHNTHVLRLARRRQPGSLSDASRREATLCRRENWCSAQAFAAEEDGADVVQGARVCERVAVDGEDVGVESFSDAALVVAEPAHRSTGRRS